MSYQMMSEMEVEVDMAPPPLSFDGHADDEDLIDYDIDTTEQHQHPTFLSPLAEGSYPDAQTDISMDLHTKLGDQVSEADEPRAIEEGDFHDHMHLDEVVEADEGTVDEHNSFNDSFVVGADVHDESKDGIADHAGETALEAHDTDNEIDYEEFEHEDASVAGKSHEGQQSFEETAQHPESQNSENFTESGLTKPTEETHLASQDQEALEPVAEAEHDEISWEHENAENEESPSHGETLSHSGQQDADEPAQANESGVENEGNEENEGNDSEARTDQEETQDDGSEKPFYLAQTDDIDVNHDKIEGAQIVELEEANFKDDLETAHDSSQEEQESFPQITVQYKGDEFPLFSWKASEGFFSDHLVLDYGMESLLAGFRIELSSEIAAGEELVFQVDELGLEFAESHLQESLSNITLRQMLEIFDLLVKNQDPYGTKTLYTYLFTKPSTSKRFDFLIESAAAGKGLDEVVHLFQSPVPHNAAFVDLAQIADSVDDHIDSYKSSPADIDGSNEDNAESGVGVNQEDEEDEEGEEGEAWTEDIPYIVDGHEDLVDDEEAFERDDSEGRVEEDEEKVEETAGETAEDAADEAADEAEEEPQEEAEAADEVEGQASQAPVDGNAYDDADRQTMPQIFDEPAITADINDYPEQHQSNPLFIHDRVDDDEPGDANDSEYEREELHLDPEQSENGDGNPSVANTDSTNTLADELDTASNLAGIQANDILDPEAIEEVLNDNDALDEIDWRNDLDLVDMTGSDSLTGAPKRARPDDEVGVEDGQDVKRRRS